MAIGHARKKIINVLYRDRCYERINFKVIEL
jgi:hypothetical protein